jgi:hypothetical protein
MANLWINSCGFELGQAPGDLAQAFASMSGFLITPDGNGTPSPT